eukprot:2980264-Amphidinium_carterae.1
MQCPCPCATESCGPRRLKGSGTLASSLHEENLCEEVLCPVFALRWAHTAYDNKCLVAASLSHTIAF